MWSSFRKKSGPLLEECGLFLLKKSVLVLEKSGLVLEKSCLLLEKSCLLSENNGRFLAGLSWPIRRSPGSDKQ
jgi:hypothetical protein